MLQRPGSKDDGAKPCPPDCSETSFNPTFNMSEFKLCCPEMRFMEFRNNPSHNGYSVLEVINLNDIFDQIADKMDNIGQVEHCWNFINEEFSM